jgi:hypothetical protein
LDFTKQRRSGEKERKDRQAHRSLAERPNPTLTLSNCARKVLGTACSLRASVESWHGMQLLAHGWT